MRIAILVDNLDNRGGVQRLVLSLAKKFNADVYTGKFNHRTGYKDFLSINLNIINKYNLPQNIEALFLRYKFKSLKLDYDFYIFLGGECLNAAKKHKPNLWLCCAPRNWLYYTTDSDLMIMNFFKRLLVRILLPILRLEDKLKVNHIERIISISKNVEDRVREIYKRDSKIIFPFVNIRKFVYKSVGDFYLSPARLTPDKRVDVIVEAFKRMPDKNLVVASGGSDFEKIKTLVKGYKNITVLGWVSDERLQNLYGTCIATVAVSLFEDFGMIAIESMAAGKPVIASGDKGFAETVINGKTGFLINPTVENIIKAVNDLTPNKAKKMRLACEKRAKMFSEERFLKKMNGIVSRFVG